MAPVTRKFTLWIHALGPSGRADRPAGLVRRECAGMRKGARTTDGERPLASSPPRWDPRSGGRAGRERVRCQEPTLAVSAAFSTGAATDLAAGAAGRAAS